jgi:hypothetical protein
MLTQALFVIADDDARIQLRARLRPKGILRGRGYAIAIPA